MATWHPGVDRSRFISQIKKALQREAIHWNRIRARLLSDGSSLFDRAIQVRNGVVVPRESLLPLAEPHGG